MFILNVTIAVLYERQCGQFFIDPQSFEFDCY